MLENYTEIKSKGLISLVGNSSGAVATLTKFDAVGNETTEEINLSKDVLETNIATLERHITALSERKVEAETLLSDIIAVMP